MSGKGFNDVLVAALREFNKVTNRDKLRNLDNHELARFLWLESGRMTVEEWEDWLNKECET